MADTHLLALLLLVLLFLLADLVPLLKQLLKEGDQVLVAVQVFVFLMVSYIGQ